MGSSNSTLKALSEKDHEYIFVTTLMRNTIVPLQEPKHNFTDYKIEKVQRITSNKELIEQRQHFSSRIDSQLEKLKKPSDVRYLFHGTPHAHKIILEGFDVSRTNPGHLFGKGICLTSFSSVANQYVWGQNKGCLQHDNVACKECTRSLLICKCVLGHVFKADRPYNNVRSLAIPYHSVLAVPTGNNLGLHIQYPEYVLFDGEQAEPVYYVEYKIIA